MFDLLSVKFMPSARQSLVVPTAGRAETLKDSTKRVTSSALQWTYVNPVSAQTKQTIMLKIYVMPPRWWYFINAPRNSERRRAIWVSPMVPGGSVMRYSHVRVTSTSDERLGWTHAAVQRPQLRSEMCCTCRKNYQKKMNTFTLRCFFVFVFLECYNC